MSFTGYKKRLPESEIRKGPMPGRLATLALCLVLMIAILAVYGQVGNHDFVSFDTPDYLTKNPYVKAGLTPQSFLWALTTTHAANWHPLTWLSHMLDVALFGLNPGAHHLTSVLIHMLNAVLVFLVFKRMTNRLWASAFIGGLFALHPMHVESVAWVAERKDLLCTLFGLLVVWMYTRYVERPAIGRYLTVVLFLILGLMSKPMLVTFPFVLLLLDFWPLRRVGAAVHSASRGVSQRQPTWPRLVVEKIPFLIIVTASSVITAVAQHRGGAVRTLVAYPLTDRISNALVAYMTYLGKLVWPFDLAFFYPSEGAVPVWKVILAATTLLAISVAVVQARRRYPYLSVGWFWYLGTLVPVIGIVQVGLQSMADRYTYIPYLGIYLMIAFGLPQLLSGLRFRRYVLAALGLGILIALGLRTWDQVGNWRDSEHLYRHALAVTRGNYVAQKNLGLVMAEKGDFRGALKQFALAVKHHPYPHSVYYSAANTLMQARQYALAEVYYRKALDLRPDYALGYYGLGLLAAQTGRTAMAIANYTAATRYDPSLAEAELNLGAVYMRQGDLASAEAHLQRALKINPYVASTHNNLGLLLVRQGHLDQAIRHFQAALRLRPDYRQAQRNLQRVKNDQLHIAKAVAGLKRAMQSDRTHPDGARELHHRYRVLMQALEAFQKALAGQPGFTEESLGNLPGVTTVLKEYEQIAKKEPNKYKE